MMIDAILLFCTNLRQLTTTTSRSVISICGIFTNIIVVKIDTYHKKMVVGDDRSSPINIMNFDHFWPVFWLKSTAEPCSFPARVKIKIYNLWRIWIVTFLVTIAIFFNIGIYQSFLKKWLQKLQFSSKIIEKDYFKIDTPNAYDQKELLYRVRKYNLTPLYNIAL